MVTRHWTAPGIKSSADQFDCQTSLLSFVKKRDDPVKRRSLYLQRSHTFRVRCGTFSPKTHKLTTPETPTCELTSPCRCKKPIPRATPSAYERRCERLMGSGACSRCKTSKRLPRARYSVTMYTCKEVSAPSFPRGLSFQTSEVYVVNWRLNVQ